MTNGVPENKGLLPDDRVRFRLRRDIRWTCGGEGATQGWIASDPLTRRLFRCSDSEYQLLQWLDECETVGELQSRFARNYHPRSIEAQEILRLVQACGKSGMLRVKAEDAARESISHSLDLQKALLPSELASTLAVPPDPRNAGRESRSAFSTLPLLSRLANAIRSTFQSQWSLGNPDRFLSSIASSTHWIYSAGACKFWTGVILLSATFLLMRWEDFVAELPTFQELRSPKALIGFGLLFVATRIVHELGHAITCKREGAACQEWGLLFLFGMACPYVDITDAWRIGDRYRRMWIAFAGMYTELVLSALAALLWWATYPGWLHQCAMQILLVCSITTLLFNANPFMKYDGYFILSDWLGVTHLRERSAATFHAWFDRDKVSHPLAARSSWSKLGLVLYFIAAKCNQWTLSAGVAVTLYVAACQWQLAGIGLVCVLLYLGSSGLLSMVSWMSQDSALRSGKRLGLRGAILGWVAVGLLIAWGSLLPVPFRVASAGVVRAKDRQPVYATVGGRIIDGLHFDEGQYVSADSRLLLLENQRIVSAALDSHKRWVELVQRQVHCQSMAYHNPELLHQLPSIEAQANAIKKRCDYWAEEIAKLDVRAPQDGWFEPAKAVMIDTPRIPGDPIQTNNGLAMVGGLRSWCSSESFGRKLEPGTLLGWLYQDNEPVIECQLTQEQVADVPLGTLAKIRLLQNPTRVFTGIVSSVSRSTQAIGGDMTTAEFAKGTAIASSGDMELSGTSVTKRSDSAALESSVYLVAIRLEESDRKGIAIRGGAEVVFQPEQRSIASLTMDFVMRNVRMR